MKDPLTSIPSIEARLAGVPPNKQEEARFHLEHLYRADQTSANRVREKEVKNPFSKNPFKDEMDEAIDKFGKTLKEKLKDFRQGGDAVPDDHLSKCLAAFEGAGIALQVAQGDYNQAAAQLQKAIDTERVDMHRSEFEELAHALFRAAVIDAIRSGVALVNTEYLKTATPEDVLRTVVKYFDEANGEYEDEGL